MLVLGFSVLRPRVWTVKLMYAGKKTGNRQPQRHHCNKPRACGQKNSDSQTDRPFSTAFSEYRLLDYNYVYGRHTQQQRGAKPWDRSTAVRLDTRICVQATCSSWNTLWMPSSLSVFGCRVMRHTVPAILFWQPQKIVKKETKGHFWRGGWLHFMNRSH